MSLNAWLVEQVSLEGKRPEVAAFWKQFEVEGMPVIETKKILTQQDLYGMKGLLGR